MVGKSLVDYVAIIKSIGRWGLKTHLCCVVADLK